ncbi:hypothetical protein [Actinomycetospora straminea]|uniref:Uncharacterized protein n=1 Tax=Actinomycetospora straminea TaxID=663607 RepID=A0ABP9EJN1_9PSEU|nr:hypothetical protein [Actinomycetospora straminea]MDD7933739.1 hypothetical protein [Actinomycetospora straminea]
MPFEFQTGFEEVDPTCIASFARTFEHADWIDGESIVQAESTAADEGFNSRFHKIIGDLDALAADARRGLECTAAVRTSLFALLAEIEAELSRLGAAVPTTMTLTPTLASFGDDPWSHFAGGAEKRIGLASAQGMMALTLPAGATLTGFRVTGRKGAGNLSVDLMRHDLAVGADPEQIVGVTPRDGNFDLKRSISAGPLATIEERFRYYVLAQVDGAALGPVRLTGIQITTMMS